MTLFPEHAIQLSKSSLICIPVATPYLYLNLVFICQTFRVFRQKANKQCLRLQYGLITIINIQ